MKVAEIYDAGYAIPLYDILANRRLWCFRDERFDLPCSALWPSVKLPGVRGAVAKIEDVRRAARG